MFIILKKFQEKILKKSYDFNLKNNKDLQELNTSSIINSSSIKSPNNNIDDSNIKFVPKDLVLPNINSSRHYSNLTHEETTNLDTS